MDVAANPVPAAPYDQAHLRVGLVPANPVDDVRPHLLEALSPANVGLLIEAGGQLEENRDLLSGVGGASQSPDDRRVTAGPIQGLLDRQHVGVRRSLADEPDDGIERLVGVVEQDVLFLDGGEEVLGLSKIDRGERPQRRLAQILEGRVVDQRPEARADRSDRPSGRYRRRRRRGGRPGACAT